MRYIYYSRYMIFFFTVIVFFATPYSSIAADTPAKNTPKTEPTRTTQQILILNIGDSIPSLKTKMTQQKKTTSALKEAKTQLTSDLKETKKKIVSELKRLEKQIDNLKLKLTELQTRLSATEGRTQDIYENTNYWGRIFSIITLLVAFAAIYLGFSAKERAISEARHAASEYFKTDGSKWIDSQVQKELSQQQVRFDEFQKELKLQSELSEIQRLWNDAITNWKQEKPEESIKVYDDIIKRFEDSPEPEIKQRVAMALFSKGFALKQQDKPEGAIKTYNDLVKRFGDASEPEIQQTIANALFSKGVTLRQQNKPEEAVKTYDDLVKHFGDASEPEIQLQVAKALFSKGFALGQQNKPEDEIKTYDDLVKRFGDASEPEIQQTIANALFSKGVTLGQQNKPEEAVNTYDDLVKRFGDASEPEIQQTIAKALLSKGFTLGQQNKPEEAIKTYDDLVNRFADASEPGIQLTVANTLVNKGIVLGQQKKWEEAIITYDDLVKRFEHSSDPKIQMTVANASASTIECSVLVENPDKTMTRITAYEQKITDSYPGTIVQFLRFLIDDKKEIIDIVEMIKQIPPETEFTWSFAELKLYITDNIKGARLQQCNAIIAFFEDHHDVARLVEELGIEGE